MYEFQEVQLQDQASFLFLLFCTWSEIKANYGLCADTDYFVKMLISQNVEAKLREHSGPLFF